MTMRGEGKPAGGLPAGVSLFRPAVMAKRVDTTFGVTLMPSHRWVSFLAVACAVLVAAGTTIVFAGSFTRRVPTVGWLVYDPGDASVQSPRPGIVTRVFRREGDVVEKGEPLVSIASGRSSSASASVEAQILATLELERAAIARQLDSVRDLDRGRTGALERTLAFTRENIQRLQAVHAGSVRRLDLAQAEADRSRQIAASGLIARSVAEKAQDAALAAAVAVEDSAQRLAQERNRLLEQEQELRAQPLLLEQRVAELASARAAIDQRIAELQGMQDALVLAPLAGRVTSVTAREGATVAANDRLLVVVPKGARLSGQLLIPTRAAGFVRPGLKVRLRYDAFPYQRYGSYLGEITQIEDALIHPAERTTPLRLDEPAYLATVALESEAVDAFGRQLPLRSGMTLRADVFQDTQRIVDWVIDPLASLKEPL